MIGLDIYPGGISFVHLKNDRKGVRVEQVQSQEVPQLIFSEGRIQAFDVLQQSLQEIVALYQLRHAVAAIHLPIQLAHIQHMQVLKGLSDIEVEMEIQFHSQQALPDTSETMSVDFTRLQNLSRKEYETIFYVMTKKAYVQEYIQCVQSSGLNVKVVDLDAFALRRAICFVLGSDLDNEHHIILYVTDHSTMFYSFFTDKLIFSRQWKTNNPDLLLEHFTDSLQLLMAGASELAIKNIILCGNGNIVKYEQILSKQYPQYNIQVPRLDIPSPAQDKYWLAYGLAMREDPLW